MSAIDCAQLRELAPELALGITDGEQRATALEHLAGCAECRATLDRIASIADDLLLLAPPVEPPAGFEQRAVAALSPAPRRPPPLRRRLAVPALAALAGAALAAALVWAALEDDRELASSYRETLAVANGEYFEAATLEAPGGEGVGYVYGYQGRASWLLAVVYDGLAPGSYRLELVDSEGGRRPARELSVGADGNGSAGGIIPVDFDRVAEVRLLDQGGRELADSELD